MKDGITLRVALDTVKPKQFLRLESVSPRGTLELRKTPKGAFAFYFRFTHGGKADRVQIGLYDNLAPPKSVNPTEKGYSISAARAAAAALSARHYEASEEGGLRAILDRERAAAEAAKVALAEAAASKEYTLEKLIGVYAESRRNQETAKEIRQLFNRNVKVQFPEVASMHANEVTTQHVISVLRKMLEAGHMTVARQLRAYLRAAFEQARRVGNNPAISKEFAPFNVQHNPVGDVESIPNTRGTDKNPLMPRALRKYWKLVNVPGKEAAFLRLHLLTGGQRLEQLIRLKKKDMKRSAIILEDTKGRTGNMKSILVPLIPAAEDALKEVMSDDDEFVFSVNPGRHISMTTVRRWAKEVIGESLEDFQLKRVRSGVTTLLAKLRVRKEVRNRIQSHGLIDVEDRHYNLYAYYSEKKKALAKIHSFLTSTGGGGRRPKRIQKLMMKRARVMPLRRKRHSRRLLQN